MAVALKIIRKISQNGNGVTALTVSDTIQRVLMVPPTHFNVEVNFHIFF